MVPPMMPSPPPSLDLSTLSEQELLSLIRRDREGLEARLKLYSQSRTLIDAAITNLALFNSLISVNQSVPNPNPNLNPSSTSEASRGVEIPSDLLVGSDGNENSAYGATSDGRMLSEEELQFRARTFSDVRRVRVSKFSKYSPSPDGVDEGDDEQTSTNNSSSTNIKDGSSNSNNSSSTNDKDGSSNSNNSSSTNDKDESCKKK